MCVFCPLYSSTFDLQPDGIKIENMEKSRCRAIAKFASRTEAIRAVREKHMDVMQNNEVQLMLVN